MKLSFLLTMTLLSYQTFGKDLIEFKNFNKNIQLEPQKNNEHLVQESQITLQLAHRLILKTKKDFKLKKLNSYMESDQSLKELYLGSDFNYLLVDLKKSKDLYRSLKKISKINGVLLVQPDMLQVRELSHGDDAHSHNPALKKTKNKGQRLGNALPIQERYYNFMGVEKIWEKTKGKGIKIAVIDEGFDLTHSEFTDLKVAMQYDFDKKALDASALSSKESHGTQIAGILFAAHDKKGINGLVPEAELIAIRQPDTWTSRTLQAFQIAKLAGADIINCSWHSQMLLQPIEDTVNDLAKQGRNGKGVAIVFAAGNQGIEITPQSLESSIESAIVVGSSGIKSDRINKNSNTGPSVDLFVFGRNARTTMPDNKYGRFSGTSLASTITSGLAALLLAQNSELTVEQLIAELKKITTIDLTRVKPIRNKMQGKKQ